MHSSNLENTYICGEKMKPFSSTSSYRMEELPYIVVYK